MAWSHTLGLTAAADYPSRASAKTAPRAGPPSISFCIGEERYQSNRNRGFLPTPQHEPRPPLLPYSRQVVATAGSGNLRSTSHPHPCSKTSGRFMGLQLLRTIRLRPGDKDLRDRSAKSYPGIVVHRIVNTRPNS